MTNEVAIRAALEMLMHKLGEDVLFSDKEVAVMEEAHAALESEPEPLAVVEGWIAEEDIKPFDGLFQIWARDALLHTAGHIPVTVTIHARKSDA